MTSSGDATIAAWREAGEAKDLPRAIGCLAGQVEVISPLTARFRFQGIGQVGEMLRAAFSVIDDIRYHTEVGAADTRAVFYYGRCRGVDFEEAQLIRLDSAGQIVELTLFGRPLPGLTTVMAAIGPELLKNENRSAMAAFVRFATAPLAGFTKFGDKRMVPLADPGRGQDR